MKLEIVKTTEVDGIWYKILKDGRNIKCWSVGRLYTDAKAKNLALLEYQKMLDIAVHGISLELIKSTEIPEL
jgi:hypothetical protein